MNTTEREKIDELLTRNDIDLSLRNRIGCVAVWLVVLILLVAVVMFTYPHIREISILAGICLGLYLTQTARSIRSSAIDKCTREKRRRSVYQPQLREALEDGNVTVERIEPTEVIEVNGGYQVTDHFDLCAVSDDQVVCFSRINLADHDHLRLPQDSQWPNTCFEIVRTARHDLWVGVFCYGDKITPTHTYRRERWCFTLDGWEADGAVFTGTPSSVVDQLRSLS